MDLEQFDENEHPNHEYLANVKKIITNVNLKYWFFQILSSSVTEIALSTEVGKDKTKKI